MKRFAVGALVLGLTVGACSSYNLTISPQVTSFPSSTGTIPASGVPGAQPQAMQLEAADMSPDGSLAAVGGRSGLSLVRLPSMEEQWNSGTPLAGDVATLAFWPDGKMIVAGRRHHWA